jgi:hypothetical protein
MFGGVGSFLIFPIAMGIIQVKLVLNTCWCDERRCVTGQDIECFEHIDAGASVDRLQRRSSTKLAEHLPRAVLEDPNTIV